MKSVSEISLTGQLAKRDQEREVSSLVSSVRKALGGLHHLTPSNSNQITSTQPLWGAGLAGEGVLLSRSKPANLKAFPGRFLRAGAG